MARLVLALTGFVLVCAIVNFAVKQHRHMDMQRQCETNLHWIGYALKQYVADSRAERYPPLSLAPGRLMFDADGFGDFAQHLISPFNPRCVDLFEAYSSNPNAVVDDHSYWYVGYVFANERSALAFLDEYRAQIPRGQPVADFHGVWPEYTESLAERQRQADREREQLPEERRKFYKGGYAGPFRFEMKVYAALREGIERTIVDEVGNPHAVDLARQNIPVLVERPELHGDGGHVLYMDGHVEFVPYPGKFPMTERFIEGLRALDALERGH